jgi:cytochrome c biogenesis protein CcdA
MQEDYKNEYEKLWDEWVPRLKSYSTNRLDLLKLSTVEMVAKAAASVTSNLILFITFFSFFVFASFALALFIGKLMGEYYLGFLVMAGFYLILFLLTLALRKNQIEKPILNQTIKKLMEDQSDEN